MVRSIKKSCNKCKAKKATQFKSGWRSSHGTFTSKQDHIPENQSLKTGHTFMDARDTKQMERLTVEEAADVQSVSGQGTINSANPKELPYTLRPRPEKEESTNGNADLSENVIINVGKMSELICHMHATMCRNPKIMVKITYRIGLCVYMSLQCAFCGYKSPSLPMSDTVEQPKGPSAGALNSMLVLSVLKSKIGLADATNVLTCLNIRPPSKQTLQKKLNYLAKTAVELNEKQMMDNQKYVARIMTLAGTEASADVQFDVAYTCRPQGGCEKAAQSFGALIEHSTTKKLPIAVATANKHCKKQGCKHTDCPKNFPSEASIASSERVLLHRSLEAVDNAGHLKISSITTDAGTQSAKAIRDYYTDRQRRAPIHYKCLIHKLRALEKHLKQLDLKSIPKKQDKQAYLRKLASSIRGRVRLELINLKKQRRSQNEFIQLANAAIGNITKCFSGDHRLCQDNSRVCDYRLQEQYNHLPYGMPLKLSDADVKTVNLKINKMFDMNGLREVSRLYNTNMCESLNSAVFNYAPKGGCWTRNFTALCHSATHSRTIGPGRATVQLATAARIHVKSNSVMLKKLKAKDRLRHYDRLRQASAKYKQARYYNRKRRMNKSLFTDSLYSSENVASCSATDHSYGLKL